MNNYNLIIHSSYGYDFEVHNQIWSSPESLLVAVFELRACTVRVLSREPNILPNFSHAHQHLHVLVRGLHSLPVDSRGRAKPRLSCPG